MNNQDNKLIEYIEEIIWATRDADRWTDNAELYLKIQKEIMELKKEFYNWHKKTYVLRSNKNDTKL